LTKIKRNELKVEDKIEYKNRKFRQYSMFKFFDLKSSPKVSDYSDKLPSFRTGDPESGEISKPAGLQLSAERPKKS
jgi:hypothetical protein